VFSYINHQESLHSCPLNKLTHSFLLWALDKQLALRAIYISGHQNQETDILLRQRVMAWGIKAPPRGGEADMQGV